MWFFAYITYLPALLLLLVALLGLLTIEIQLAALKPTEASAQAQVDAGLSGFKDQIRAKINNATQASSLAYSSASNAVLSDLENSVNNGMVCHHPAGRFQRFLTVIYPVCLDKHDDGHSQHDDQ